jgi:monofunctional biosynthetic peptidoglycan transglycosylase
MVGVVLRWMVRIVLGFVVLSVAMTAIYRFVPPPFTWTMMGDLLGGHGVTKRWLPLSKMDSDMPRAAIAGEDSRFCTHSGFDFKAIAGAAYRNA